MSIALDASSLSNAERQELVKRLTIKIQPNPEYPPQNVTAFEVLSKSSIACAFSVGMKYPQTIHQHAPVVFDSVQPEVKKRSKKKAAPSVAPCANPLEASMNGSLTPVQVKVHAEAWPKLLANKSIMLNLGCGLGKVRPKSLRFTGSSLLALVRPTHWARRPL